MSGLNVNGFYILWEDEDTDKRVNEFATYFMTWSIGKKGSVLLKGNSMTLNVDMRSTM